MTKVKSEVEVKAVTVPVIDGLTKEQAFNSLFQSGIEYKEVQKIWKEKGATAIRGGVFQAGLDWLAAEPRTQNDLADYILEFGTANEARWFGQRDAIRKLSIQVRGIEKFIDTPATESQKEALKARYAKVDA